MGISTYPYCKINIKAPLIIVLLFVQSVLHAQITSTFNSNTEGWTTPMDADATIGYNSTGGNPNGHVFGSPFVFVGGAGTFYFNFYFVAPSSYLGDRSAYYNGTLRYDIQQSTSGTPNQYAEVTISNSSGVVLYYFPTVSNQPSAPPLWSTFVVTLNNSLGYWKTTNSPSGPMATEAQIQGVLSDVSSLQLRGLYRDANTTNRLDNVAMTPPIIITTQPVSTSVCQGTTATLTTSATNNPSLTYRWQRFNAATGGYSDLNNDAVYSGVSTTTLSIVTTTGAGAGDYRCRISGTNVTDAFTNSAIVTVNANPAPPGSTGNAACGPSAVTLNASGGAAGQYRWYTVFSGGTPIAGQTNSSYTTPVISSSGTYYVSINDGTCESTRTPVIATINTIPLTPAATGVANCGSASLTLNASGGTVGQYRWYTVPTGGSSIPGETNNSYTTPVLATTTTYYVSINNGTCESARTSVVATINILPAAPSTIGNSACGASAITLNASGGAAGQYRWYTLSSGGSPIAGQTNSAYTTPVISSSRTYYVSINDGTCESTRTPVIATINTIPPTPVAIGVANCGSASLTLNASGGTAGQYRWYTVSTGGTSIPGQTNSSYTTPVLATTTTYYVSINNGTCEGNRAPAVATINTAPPAPSTTGNSFCGPSAITLLASGGSAGQYRWYTVPTGGTAITGQTNGSYTTPVLNSTTIYYVSRNNGSCESTRTSVTATINTIPVLPTATNTDRCGSGQLVLTASGGISGQYRWYNQATGGTAFSGAVDDTYTTPSLTSSTNFYVALNNGTCEGARTQIVATINLVPSAPGATAASNCTAASLTLTASGSVDGNYVWYDVPTGGNPIPGEVNSTFTTPTLTNTTTYYVAITNGPCESSRTAVIATIGGAACSNNPPSITSSSTSTNIAGTASIDLSNLINDSDNNLDPTSLKVIIQPTSGAMAEIVNNILSVDYSGLTFAGTDILTLEVCDLLGSCAQQVFTIEVEGEINTYNGISPNGDFFNDVWIIQNIESLPDTRLNHVSLFNRWGDLVFEVDNYDNNNKVFSGITKNGDEISSGVYFYKIEFSSGRKTIAGYLNIVR